jgi:hypothetical protein
MPNRTSQKDRRRPPRPFGAFIFTGGALELASVDTEANRTASPSPAATTIRCRPKVSELSSPHRHDAEGENLVEFDGPEHQ